MTEISSTPTQTIESAGAATPPELAIIIPTYNERENIRPLVRLLHETLEGNQWEAIFVDDDSPDQTAAEVRALSHEDQRVRCIQRIGRRGLSSAVIEGMMATSAEFVAVMDADLQHDERLLADMLEVLRTTDNDIAIGSRMVSGGDNTSLGGLRQKFSEVSSRLARKILGIEVRDLMSGFFMVRRAVVEATVRDFSGVGFKILMDILASSPHKLKYVELPYSFRPRQAGDSKLDANAAVALVLTLIDKSVGRVVPTRLVAFLMVGGFGVLVHFLALAAALTVLDARFVVAQSIATLIAMTSNFAINNLFTYSDVRLRGWRWLSGWFSFVLACGFGAIANVGVASVMFAGAFGWQLSALAGILVGTAWNYGVTRMYTWRQG